MATNNNEAKIRFTAETGGFNDSIGKSREEMSRLRAELKLNATQAKGSADSLENLKERQALLTEEQQEARNITENLTAKLNKAVEIYGENSSEVSKLKRQLANARTEEERVTQQLDACNDQLRQQAKASGDAEESTESLSDKIERQEAELKDLKSEYVETVLQYGKNSKEAKALGREIKELSGELRDNKNEMSSAEGAADKLDKSLEGAGDSARLSGDGFTVAKGAIADLASEAVQLGIEKVSEFVGWLKELPEATRELRQDMTTLETSFETQGFTVEEATDTWTNLYRIFGEDDRAVEAANLIAKIADNEKELAEWTTITQGVYGQFQDSLPVEGLAEAAMETSKTGTVTGVLADALNWGAKEGERFGVTTKQNIEFTELSSKELEKLTEKQREEYEARKAQYEAIEEYNTTIEEATSAEEFFNLALQECTTEEERQKLISETLMSIYGESAKKYEEAAGSQLEAKEATAENTLAQAELAETIEPVTTAWTGLKTQLLTAVAPAIEGVCGLLQDALKWLQEHPTATKILVGVLATLAAGIIAVSVAVGIFAVAQMAANTALLPVIGIIALVVAAIAAVVAIVILCIEYWDEIVAAVKTCWESVKATLSEWWTWIDTNVIQPIAQFFSDLWQSVSTTATETWNAIKEFFAGIPTWFNETVIQPIVNFFTGLWQSVVDIWNTICNAIQVAIMFIGSILSAAFQIITLPFRFIWENCKEYVFAAWNWIKNVVSNAINAVRTVMSNVMNSIKAKFTAVWNSIKEFLAPILTAVKNAISNAWENVKNTTSNVWNSIKNFFSNVWNSIKTAVSNAIETVKNYVSNGFNTVKNTVSNIWNGIKTTISNVWNNIKSGVSNAINGVKNTVSNVFNSVKSSVTNIWNQIKTAITKPIEEAKNAVKNAIDKIKGFFDFDWSLPDLKMPHFEIVGSFSLNPPSVPHLSVEWYAKAMNNPMILNGATIFGAANGRLLGGGETGREMIGGVDTVASMIQNAVDRSFRSLNLNALADAIEDIANRPIEMNINGRQFALATASDGDSVNGLRSTFKSRGLIVE